MDHQTCRLVDSKYALLWGLLGYEIGSKVAIAEPVGVQRRVAVIPVNTAVIFIGAALRDELDLDRTSAELEPGFEVETVTSLMASVRGRT